MDRTTVYTKTAKGMMEATGKTSVLSRDMRALLKEIDGKAAVGDVQAKLGKVPEATLQEALKALVKNDFIREFKQPQTAAPPPSPAGGDFDLDFTMAIPTVASLAKKAEEEARQKAEAAAQAAARAKAEAEARAKQEAEARAKTAAAAAQAAARAKAETQAKARAAAEARARAEAEARAKREAEERTRKEAEDRARKEAEEKARREAEELRAKLDEERKAREEAERKAKEEAERERKEAEEKARREAEELRAKLEEERKAREEAERRAKEEAERERKEAEEKARREADELRARLEEERQAREAAERKAKEEAERREQEVAERKAREHAERQLREEAERKAREDAERARKEAEEKARREGDELRARLEEERQAREEAERRAREETERRAREDAERQAREEAERQRREAEDAARREAEAQARRVAEERAASLEQERIDAEVRTRGEAETQARRQAEERALAQERERAEAEARARKEAEDAQRRADEQAARKAQEQAERERREAGEESARVAAEQRQAQAESGPTLEDMVSIETNFDAVLGAGGGAAPDAASRRADAEDKLRKEAEEQARLQAAEQAEAEAQARAKADAEAKRDEEERLRREEEARQQASATDDAADLAAAQMREHAEAQALLDAQNAETERHFAEMEKEMDAEQAMSGGRIQTSESREDVRAREQEETRERFRAAEAAHAAEAAQEAEPAPVAYRQRINWGKPVAIGLFLLMVLGLISVHFVSFDGYIPQFEKLAGAHMQQPVKINALHLSLVPQPHWRLDGVSVGTSGELVVPRVNAIPELGSLFSEKKVFTSIELESPVLSEDGMLALLFGKAAGQDLRVENISVKNGKLDSKTFILPVLDAKIAFGEDGAWRQIALDTPDHKTSLLLKPEGEGAQLEVETNAFSLPFHPSFILENLVAKGTIRRGELRLSEFKGGIYGGYLSGNADLKWGAGWSLGGEISVRAMDPARFAPALMEEGKLEGKAQYAMRAKSYDELFAAPRLEGDFTVLKGTLLGVDLARLLQGGDVGGKTAFTELTGGFVREAGRTQLRQMLLSAGPVSAGGSAEVDAGKRISGRYTVEIKSPVAKARANFAVAGTLKEPRFSR